MTVLATETVIFLQRLIVCPAIFAQALRYTAQQRANTYSSYTMHPKSDKMNHTIVLCLSKKSKT